MSYCRWSSMNWMCDLYCYEDVSGCWTTHVAASKRAHPPTDPGPMPIGEPAGGQAWHDWFDRYRQSQKELETIPLVPLGLPHDGESYYDDTLEEFRDRLLALRAAGYRFPDYVLDEVAEEMAENGEAV